MNQPIGPTPENAPRVLATGATGPAPSAHPLSRTISSQISLATQLVLPEQRVFEVVERKGLGHPDTMADMIADQFSYEYGQYCISSFGHVLNHAVDKVTLVGASTRIELGSFDVLSPAIIMLIGKITPAVGTKRIPLYDIFRNAVEKVIEFTLREDSILRYMNLIIHNSFSAPLDRPANFYLPDSETEARSIHSSETGANDTVFCTAFAGLSPLERLTTDIELAVTAPGNRPFWPEGIGTDVKVMAARRGLDVDLTVCIPVDPRFAADRSTYECAISSVETGLQRLISTSAFPCAKLHVNTKDADGGMYLAPFGTSLGKSDCGAVGRGNRAIGFISAYRPANIEAPSGKNPLHHAGRLYSVATQIIADRISTELGINCAVTIVARNGDAINNPAFVHVDLSSTEADKANVREIVLGTLAGMDSVSRDLVQTDPSFIRLPIPDARQLVP